jgi:ribosome-associated protein
MSESEGGIQDGEAPRDDRAIAVACAQFSLEKKARDVRLLFVGDRLGIAEYFVLATVNNRRQARAVRDGVRLGLKGLGYGVPQAASEDPDGRWSLYDYGGVVLHMFDDEGREYFDLDAVWADVPEIEVEDSLSTASSESAAEAEDTEDTDG